MKPTRALVLRKETLVELAGDDLRQVVGASGPTCAPHLCPSGWALCGSDYQECLTERCVPTGQCPASLGTGC